MLAIFEGTFVAAAMMLALQGQWQVAFWVALLPPAFVLAVLIAPVAAWTILETKAPATAQRLTQLASVAAACVFVLAGLWLWGGYAAVALAPTAASAYWWRYYEDIGAEYDNVVVESRPHDCDFIASPIGAKHCRYEARIATVRIRSDANGTPSASYDGGTRWTSYDATRPRQPSVYVSWTKVEE